MSCQRPSRHSGRRREARASGYVASDMDNAVFQCLAFPGIPDGTLPRCVLLVCHVQEFDGLEGIAHTCDGVGLGDNCGTEGAHGEDEAHSCVWNDSTSLKINNSPLTCSSECSLAFVPPASASHDGDGLTCTATCAESYEAKSRATALTIQICHFDGYTYADTGLQFTSCVTTALSQCSDSPVAHTAKFDGPDCTNSTVGETYVVGCATGYERPSGDSLRALTCVSENESLPACQVTRCSTGTNPAPIGVSEDCEDIPYGSSCRAAGAVGFESAKHTAFSCFAIGQLESNPVPSYSVCEEKKCVVVATFDSSMLAPDSTDLTSW